MSINRLAGYFNHFGPSSPEPSVHEAIAHHQQNGDWVHRNAVLWLNQLKDRFVVDFKIQIEEVVIGVAKLPVKVPGQYRETHNALGVEREVLVSALFLYKSCVDRRFDIAGVLLHELLHAEQHNTGCGASKPTHHNKRFRRRAAELGLIVREDGSQGYRAGHNPLFALLNELGVTTPELRTDWFPEVAKPKGQSSLHKYVCQCLKPQTFRSGRRDFRALCPDCESPFEIVE
jgi:hypothetical protein